MQKYEITQLTEQFGGKQKASTRHRTPFIFVAHTFVITSYYVHCVRAVSVHKCVRIRVLHPVSAQVDAYDLWALHAKLPFSRPATKRWSGHSHPCHHALAFLPHINITYLLYVLFALFVCFVKFEFSIALNRSKAQNTHERKYKISFDVSEFWIKNKISNTMRIFECIKKKTQKNVETFQFEITTTTQPKWLSTFWWWNIYSRFFISIFFPQYSRFSSLRI